MLSKSLSNDEHFMQKAQRGKNLSPSAAIKRNGNRNIRLRRKRANNMTQWNQSNVRPHMKVYTSDAEHAGHIAEVYEDSFLIHKGYFFPADRYIPYSAVSRIEENEVHLALDSTQIQDVVWKKRPDYEHHPGDPTQLFYDRGHGINDPYEETDFRQPPG